MEPSLSVLDPQVNIRARNFCRNLFIGFDYKTLQAEGNKDRKLLTLLNETRWQEWQAIFNVNW